MMKLTRLFIIALVVGVLITFVLLQFVKIPASVIPSTAPLKYIASRGDRYPKQIFDQYAGQIPKQVADQLPEQVPTREDDMKSIMQERALKIRAVCEKLKTNETEFHTIPKSKLDHIVVDDNYKVLYCYVPKVACTNLKRVFLMLTGKLNVTDPLQLPSADVHSIYREGYLNYLDDYPANEIKDKLRTYKKVIFVREPLERLLSAFRNKFVERGNTYFKERYGRKIIKHYRKNASEDALEMGTTVTFSEFIQFLLDDKMEEKGYNEHWRPFFDLCHPCHLNYNFIGKYETLDEDVDGLLKLLEVDDWIRFPKRGDLYKSLKTEDLFLNFYKSVDPNLLRDVVDIYSRDFNMFDYAVPYSVQRFMSKAEG